VNPPNPRLHRTGAEQPEVVQRLSGAAAGSGRAQRLEPFIRQLRTLEKVFDPVNYKEKYLTCFIDIIHDFK